MAAFSPAARAAALAALPATELDLLVIGGGITGAGIARDAALRGLSVALVEAVDFAAGTSSRSSKLIHGGVRYLQQGDVGLVREAASERARIRRIAPHLADTLLMVMPTYGRGMHMKLGAGLWTFEKLASVDADERHAMWDRAEALAEEPCLAPDGLHGAAAFFEYLTDDARLVFETVAGAAAAGALCANHAEVTAVDRGRITVRDTAGDRTLETRARVVVNAAGPWVEEIWRRAGTRGSRGLQLTKGIHLVVDHARLPVRHAVVMQARDQRSVFAVPRDGITYLGTTDTLFDSPVLYPGIRADDVEYLLDAANRTFAGAPLARGDVLASWAGLRPLLREEGKSPSEISRKDEIATDPASGLISIAGGKLTTYRRMAERVVDLVFARLGPQVAAVPDGRGSAAGRRADDARRGSRGATAATAVGARGGSPLPAARRGLRRHHRTRRRRPRCRRGGRGTSRRATGGDRARTRRGDGAHPGGSARPPHAVAVVRSPARARRRRGGGRDRRCPARLGRREDGSGDRRLPPRWRTALRSFA